MVLANKSYYISLSSLLVKATACTLHQPLVSSDSETVCKCVLDMFTCSCMQLLSLGHWAHKICIWHWVQWPDVHMHMPTQHQSLLTAQPPTRTQWVQAWKSHENGLRLNICITFPSPNQIKVTCGWQTAAPGQLLRSNNQHPIQKVPGWGC